MTKYYTGIGSREVPLEIYELMTKVAEFLSGQGFILRSGGADGSDSAFELGAKEMEIYLPWNGFNNRRTNQLHDDKYLVPSEFGNYSYAELITKMTHPACDKLNDTTWKFHNRNVYQILGKNLLTPSNFVVLYAPTTTDGVKGGTNTAYTIAKRMGIKTYNLYVSEERKLIEEKLLDDV